MESEANKTQVGGDHYGALEYQHWDWVCDIKLHYLLACATKYVVRWRQKNGAEDLRKAIHYIEKAKERSVYAEPEWANSADTHRFCRPLPFVDFLAVAYACIGDYDEAIGCISRLLAAEQPPEEPTP